MDLRQECRREAYEKRPTHRQEVILAVLGDGLMTAREIADEIGFPDMNMVRPRLTELTDMGLIEVSGCAYDEKTRRNVAVYARV